MKLASRKRPVFISLIFIIFIATIGFYTAQHLKDKRHQHSANEDDISQVVSDESKIVSVSAEELMSHYRSDAYGANKEYSDDSIQHGS